MVLFGKVSISLGVLNALSNIILWMMTTICAVVSERIYRIVASHDCSEKGWTRATDATEISLVAWMMPDRVKRRKAPVWWVILLLSLNVLLLPLEILSESGIDEYRKCYPKTVRTVGVCASRWTGRNLHGCSATAILVARFDWVEKEWNAVIEGTPKLPDGQQVHVLENMHDKNRKFLVKDCSIEVTGCTNTTNCGEMTFYPGVHAIEAFNWTGVPTNALRHGGYAHEGDVKVGHLFWETGTVAAPEPNYPNRSRIGIAGIEMVMNEAEGGQVESLQSHEGHAVRSGYGYGNRQHTIHSSGHGGHGAHHGTPATPEEVKVRVEAARARQYKVSCTTDGIPASDLAKALSVYRTAGLDAPAVMRTNLTTTLADVSAVTINEVARAIYSFKLADFNDKCTRDIEMYTTCGAFKAEFVLPFICMVVTIVLGWISIACVLPKPHADVPVDAQAWRAQAQLAMRQAVPEEMALERKMSAKQIASKSKSKSTDLLDENDCDFEANQAEDFDDELLVTSARLHSLQSFVR